jgi:predicted Rossmann fold flavoprotein
MPNTVTIIGAGPAGMTAALFAVRAGAQVRLIESNPMVGRKLLVTGSGRANLTNQFVEASRYTCTDSDWMQSLLGKFGHKELVRFLESIGVLVFSTSDGWCYPVSESAQTVVDAFKNALKLAQVELILNAKVTAINKSHHGYCLSLASGNELNCDNLIVAAGGKAYPTLGSRGELFDSLKNLGHKILPLSPALAPVTCNMDPYKRLLGVRLDARASLFEGDALLAETTGNLIFTQWGLNGPAVMDLSHFISRRAGSKLVLRLNLLHRFESDLRDLIKNQQKTLTPLRVILGAVLPPKVPLVILPFAGLSSEILVNEITDAQIDKLFSLLTALPFEVTGVRGFEYCQISSGGVPVNEVDPLTMRSLLIPNLALAGETLDVVGPCGGYNLQFAFSSGAVAGMNISKQN